MERIKVEPVESGVRVDVAPNPPFNSGKNEQWNAFPRATMFDRIRNGMFCRWTGTPISQRIVVEGSGPTFLMSKNVTRAAPCARRPPPRGAR